MKLEIKRKVPIRKMLCLYCGEERLGYEVTVHQINNHAQTLGMCKQCVMEMSYHMNEIIANEVIVEMYKGEPQIVRIFKTWNINFVESPLADMRGEKE